MDMISLRPVLLIEKGVVRSLVRLDPYTIISVEATFKITRPPLTQVPQNAKKGVKGRAYAIANDGPVKIATSVLGRAGVRPCHPFGAERNPALLAAAEGRRRTPDILSRQT